MDKGLFERLLYEEESPTLDFKKEQYRFAKATQEEKAELLKDVLGFANAWRRSEAYILIGVEDVRGGRANVVGIPSGDHLADHSLQQFVNSLTNRPVRFHYEAFGFEGKQVGVIRIEEQPRPFYLKKCYGKLKEKEVYVRRGSSTDPTKPASPEEIAEMGRNSVPEDAELVVEFADIERDNALGMHISWDAEYCETPPRESIPELVVPTADDPFSSNWLLMRSGSTERLNENYFREMALYEFARRLCRPVRLVIKNVGQVSANRVRAELAIPMTLGVWVLYPSDMPTAPRPYRDRVPHIAGEHLHPVFRPSPGLVTIHKNDDRFQVEIDCGSLQPGRWVWSDLFYIAKGESGDVSLIGRIFADNLSHPKDFNLSVSGNVAKTRLSVDELTSLPEPVTDDE